MAHLRSCIFCHLAGGCLVCNHLPARRFRPYRQFLGMCIYRRVDILRNVLSWLFGLFCKFLPELFESDMRNVFVSADKRGDMRQSKSVLAFGDRGCHMILEFRLSGFLIHSPSAKPAATAVVAVLVICCCVCVHGFLIAISRLLVISSTLFCACSGDISPSVASVMISPSNNEAESMRILSRRMSSMVRLDMA